MLTQFQDYLTFENIYIWTNFGILPFWIMLIVIPNSKVTQFFVNSIILPLILSTAYVYIFYQIIILEESIIDVFNLYLSLDELLILFSEKNFIIIFWIHFLAINLFCGSWIVRDYQKINMPKFLAFFPLILTYFIGPLGLCIYWLFRIFYSKRLDLYE